MNKSEKKARVCYNQYRSYMARSLQTLRIKSLAGNCVRNAFVLQIGALDLLSAGPSLRQQQYMNKLLLRKNVDT